MTETTVSLVGAVVAIITALLAYGVLAMLVVAIRSRGSRPFRLRLKGLGISVEVDNKESRPSPLDGPDL